MANKAPNFENKELIDFLKLKGYSLLKVLGEGMNAISYQAYYEPLNQLRTIKIEKEHPREGSITGIVNNSENRAEKSLLIQNKLNHPNISKTWDAFGFEGRMISVEEYFSDITLEQKIKIDNKGIKRSTFKKLMDYVWDNFDYDSFLNVANQLVSAISYANSQGILHRDVKLSNTVYDPKTRHIKVIDWRDALGIDEIISKLTPSHGQTKYTHPKLINAMIDGIEAKADIETELYSLECALYELATGQAPFNYALKEDSNGKIAVINGKEVRYSLFDGDKKIERIDEDTHYKKGHNLKFNLPKKLRNSDIFDALTGSIEGTNIHSSKDLENHLKVIETGKDHKIFYAGISALLGISLIASLVSWDNSVQEAKEKEKELSKYRIERYFDESNAELKNNLVEINVLTSKDIFDLNYVPAKFFSVEKGELLTPKIRLNDIIQFNSTIINYTFNLDLPGIFSSSHRMHRHFSLTSPHFGIDNQFNPLIKIPEDACDIVSYMTCSVFGDEGSDLINFNGKENALAVKRIPVVIGNPALKYAITSFKYTSTYDPMAVTVGLSKLDGKSNESPMDLLLEVLETGYRATAEAHSDGETIIRLAPDSLSGAKTIKISAFYEGKKFTQAVFPAQNMVFFESTHEVTLETGVKGMKTYTSKEIGTKYRFNNYEYRNHDSSFIKQSSNVLNSRSLGYDGKHR